MSADGNDLPRPPALGRGSSAPCWQIRHVPAVSFELELIFVGMVIQTTTLVVMSHVEDARVMAMALHVLGFLVGSVGMIWVLRRTGQKPATFEIGEEGLEISHGDQLAALVPFNRIYSVELRERWPRVLQVGVRSRLPINVPVRHFSSLESASEFRQALRDRLGAEVEPSVLDARERVASRGLSRPPSTTLIVALGLFMIAVSEFAVGALQDSESLTRLGAVLGESAADGDWWRLLTGALLHWDATHLALNLMNLLLFGLFLEPILGRARWIVLLGTSSLAGIALWGVLHPSVVAVGASAGVMGAVGALIALNWMRRSELSCILRLPATALVYFTVISVVSEMVVPDLATEAHVAGLVSGFLLFPVLTKGKPLDRLVEETPGWIRVSAWVLGVAYVGAAGWIVVQAVRMSAG